MSYGAVPTGAARGRAVPTTATIRMHIEDQEKRKEEGRALVKTIHFVDYKSIVDMARRPRLDEPRVLAKLANRPQWITLWTLMKGITEDEFEIRHQYSHQGDRGEYLVDRHAKRAARKGASPWRIRPDLVDVGITLAWNGIPVPHGVTTVMKAVAGAAHEHEWHAQKSRGKLAEDLAAHGAKCARKGTTRFEHRALCSCLPTAVVNHRDRPHLYDSDECWLCGEGVENTAHWLLKCPGQDKMLEVRTRLIKECDDVISAVLRPSDVVMAEGWTRRDPTWGALGESGPEWTRTRGIIEHAFTARWTSVEGDKVTIRRGNGTDKGKGMTTEVFWRLMALWQGNERDGAAFAEAACACLDTLHPGAVRTGCSARKEEMCWATPWNQLWTFVEELAIEGELTCDLLNLFEGFKKWFTWEDLTLFTGNGRVQRDGLTTQAFNSVRRGYINPEYNGGDVGHGEVDDHARGLLRITTRRPDRRSRGCA